MDTITRPYALIETRRQKSVGSTYGFGGPDEYIAVVMVDPSQTLSPYRPGRSNVRARLGVSVWYCGEYYSRHTTSRSRMYTSSAKKAEARKNKLDKEIALGLPHVKPYDYLLALESLLSEAPKLVSQPH